jgi:site-specific DNA-methyltransferase (adenine-specific)
MHWKDKYLNKAIHGDCMDVMKDLPDKCIDLVLTDPPYRNREDNQPTIHMRVGSGVDDFGDKLYEGQYKEIKRISKNQIIWGANNFECIPSFKGFIVYKKTTIPLKFTMSMAEIAMISNDLGTTSKVVEFNPNGDKSHPTQKPVELMVWCLENYLLKNWKEDRRPIVFDGFAGSGTTAVACKKCGCDYILVEQDADYVEICNKRLAQETLF